MARPWVVYTGHNNADSRNRVAFQRVISSGNLLDTALERGCGGNLLLLKNAPGIIDQGDRHLCAAEVDCKDVTHPFPALTVYSPGASLAEND